MSELERRRGARDVWVSRSHIAAAASGAFLLAAVSFVTGWQLGLGSGTVVSLPVSTEADDANERLMELLARVEGSGHLDGGVGQLTFPEELQGAFVGPDAPLPPSSGDEGPQFKLGGLDVAQWGGADAPPSADHAAVKVAEGLGRLQALELRDRLRGQMLDARAVPALIDGDSVWRVTVVFSSLEDANAWSATQLSYQGGRQSH